MSISDVSGAATLVSSSQLQQMQANSQQMKSNFDQLSKSLAAGDLSGAQQAYAAIEKLQGANPPPGGANSQVQQDFTDLGTASSRVIRRRRRRRSPSCNRMCRRAGQRIARRKTRHPPATWMRLRPPRRAI